MSQNGRALVEQMHQEAVRRRWEQNAQERAFIEQFHREALERRRKEEEGGRALVKKVHREAAERSEATPAVGQNLPAISCTELPEARPDDIFFREWNTYRREVGRLLGEGHEARFVLIKGESVLGIFDTWDAARQAGLKQYLLQPFLVHQILRGEPILRLRGYNLPCPTSASPWARVARKSRS